jgi:hypothetical protein
MKGFARSLMIGAVMSACLGSISAAFADTAQEVFICKLNEGKTMADLHKVIGDFKQMIGKLKGGDRYQAWVLTPVAADDLSNVVWIGEMPDGMALTALQEDYRSSEAGQAQDKKFQKVMTCRSRSIWNSERVK